MSDFDDDPVRTAVYMRGLANGRAEGAAELTALRAERDAALKRCEALAAAIAEGAWILRYADQDMPDENFSGYGAEDAARERFKRQRSAWSITLFREVDRG